MLTTGCENDLNNDTLSASTQNVNLKSTSDYLALAKRWAPISYQDVDATGTYSLSGKSDYITSVNFDGDWVATNNWDNIEDYDAYAYCYYSVIETSTNWFITYAFFHPRDWTDVFLLYELDQHENDLEGVLFVIAKDGTDYGSLEAAVTVYHSDFYSYLPESSTYEENYESVDGTLSFITYNNESHPVIAQEAKGHGLKAYPYIDIDGDGVIYYPSMDDESEVPESVYDTDVKYKLIDIFEDDGLWDQRTNTDLFSGESAGFLSSVGSGNANPPWNWGDSDDDMATGDFAKYPAGLIAEYFKNLGDYSFKYTTNDYVGTVLNKGSYYIVAKHSDLVLDVYNSSSEDGANVIQYENVETDNQIWRIYTYDDDYNYLLSKESGLALDVYDNSLENGGNINQWTYSGGDNQLWLFDESDEAGYFHIQSKNSGLVVDVDDASTENEANVQQWEENGDDNQLFKLEWACPIDYE